VTKGPSSGWPLEAEDTVFFKAPVEVAIVNNMPDAAFEETEHQLSTLLLAAAPTRGLALRLSSIPDARRSRVVKATIASRYEPLEHLYEQPPDALVVTGTEPTCAELTDEPLWGDLSRLLSWSQSATSSVLLSCLAAHGALLALDGVPRARRPRKLTGVYPQTLDPTHPLTRDLGPLACPHSRLHDVPTEALEVHGYQVVMGSQEAGWSLAVRDAGCFTILAQGHPEYAPTALLREHRRDVRRYLVGQLDVYPEIPSHYLDDHARGLLERFGARARGGPRDAAVMEDFPFKACSQGIAFSWHRPMERLIGNWLEEVARRKHHHLSGRVG